MQSMCWSTGVGQNNRNTSKHKNSFKSQKLVLDMKSFIVLKQWSCLWPTSAVVKLQLFFLLGSEVIRVMTNTPEAGYLMSNALIAFNIELKNLILCDSVLLQLNAVLSIINT